MKKPILATLPLALAFLPALAQAQDSGKPPLCSDRPGKASPTCVVAPGTFQIETSVADWTHDHAGGETDDDILYADSLLRYGIANNLEARVSITPYEHDRAERGGLVSRGDGFGDVGIGVRYTAIDGGDSGLSLALEPDATLPVGSHEVSQGTWSASFAAPVTMPLPGGWSLAATPVVYAAADSDGDGRHFAYSGVGAVSKSVGGGVTLSGELWALRDEDPTGHVTRTSLDLLSAWQTGPDTQFDLSSYIGLNHNTADVEILGGFTRRF